MHSSYLWRPKAKAMNQQRFSKIPFDPQKSPFFYGWVVIAVGTLGMLMTIPGQTIGLSTFTDSLIDALGVSRDNISWAYMGGTVCSSLLLTKAGKLFDRFGARPVAIVASVCLGLGLLYMSQTDVIIGTLKELTGIAHLPMAMMVIFLGFLLIRFFGQGVLTLSNRTMMMKWFDEWRGFALGFSSVFISGGFSIAPAVIEYLIQTYTWKGAWMNLALILIVVFPVLIFLFYRNDPSDSGLKADGNMKWGKKKKVSRFPIRKDFELSEARKTMAFWVFAGYLSLQGLLITGFTFHVVSIFEEAGSNRETAVSIFQYIAIIAIIFTLVFSAWSDFIKLKYLLYIKSFGVFLSLFGMIFLGQYEMAFYSLIVGTGIASGMYGVVSAVCWPRFFGKQHLGAIVGQVMTLLVFGSALGPIMFSKSLTIFGSYDAAAWICFGGFIILTLGALVVRNPQTRLSE